PRTQCCRSRHVSPLRARGPCRKRRFTVFSPLRAHIMHERNPAHAMLQALFALTSQTSNDAVVHHDDGGGDAVWVTSPNKGTQWNEMPRAVSYANLVRAA